MSARGALHEILAAINDKPVDADRDANGIEGVRVLIQRTIREEIEKIRVAGLCRQCEEWTDDRYAICADCRADGYYRIGEPAIYTEVHTKEGSNR